MKPHVRIKLHRSLVEEYIPHWQTLLHNRHLERETFLPEIDKVFFGNNIHFLVAREYQPAASEWSSDEIASGLNRVYRLILTRSGRVPAALIESLRIIPAIEQVSPGGIGQMELNPRSTMFSTRTDRASRDAIYLNEAQTFTEGDTPRLSHKKFACFNIATKLSGQSVNLSIIF